MNSKRRAELQRRLSMGAVPRPPAGLAERIKNDIPKYLEAEPERERFSRSIAFSMRIAASILLLITSVFVTLRYLEPDATSNMAVAKRAPVELTPAVMPLSQPQRSDKTETTASAAPTEEIRLEMTEELPKMKVAPSEVAAAQVAQNETKKESDFVRERDDENTGRRREAVQPQAISVTAAAPMIEPAA
ncbi:MAG TPA: hypothetical protein VJZ00_25390, partial [Thermoanaerobaculia bacterium]|nr:hypothetical protein [Thermoanaerobaculia bacterium]